MTKRPPAYSLLLRLTVGLLLGSISLAAHAEDPPKSKTDATQWRSLFNGKDLGNWKLVKGDDFAIPKDREKNGSAPAVVKSGEIQLDVGDSATGIKWEGKFPKSNYEIELEAKRTAGSDFFCGLTFPVQESGLTLITGGWGGWVVGLSCLDGFYAIKNDTVVPIKFKNDQWYRIRVRVDEKAVEVWVDDKSIIYIEVDDHKLTVSEEMQPCMPLGIATWNTASSVRNLRYHELKKKK